MKQKGFTLIELLVVISVIGLLASVILVTLNNQRLKARNVRRIADIHQLVNAFSQYINNPGATFPIEAGKNPCISLTCSGGWSGASFAADPALTALIVPTYLSALPSDPQDQGQRTEGGYVYGYNAAPWTSGWSGNNFSAGAAIFWNMEPSSYANTCGDFGAGAVYRNQGGQEVDCVVVIN